MCCGAVARCASYDAHLATAPQHMLYVLSLVDKLKQYSIMFTYYPLHSSYMFPNGLKEKYMFVHKELQCTQAQSPQNFAICFFPKG